MNNLADITSEDQLNAHIKDLMDTEVARLTAIDYRRFMWEQTEGKHITTTCSSRDSNGLCCGQCYGCSGFGGTPL